MVHSTHRDCIEQQVSHKTYVSHIKRQETGTLVAEFDRPVMCSAKNLIGQANCLFVGPSLSIFIWHPNSRFWRDCMIAQDIPYWCV